MTYVLTVLSFPCVGCRTLGACFPTVALRYSKSSFLCVGDCRLVDRCVLAEACSMSSVLLVRTQRRTSCLDDDLDGGVVRFGYGLSVDPSPDLGRVPRLGCCFTICRCFRAWRPHTLLSLCFCGACPSVHRAACEISASAGSRGVSFAAVHL